MKIGSASGGALGKTTEFANIQVYQKDRLEGNIEYLKKEVKYWKRGCFVCVVMAILAGLI